MIPDIASNEEQRGVKGLRPLGRYPSSTGVAANCPGSAELFT